MEIIFVDDGSRDRTFTVAESNRQERRTPRVIKFRRTTDRHRPWPRGSITLAENLVTMDGDLQNDPEDIPRFMRRSVRIRHRLRLEGKTPGQTVTRKIPSKVANWLIGKSRGFPFADIGCSLKAYRRESHPEDTTYIRICIVSSRDGVDRRKQGRPDSGPSPREEIREVEIRPLRIYKVLLELLMIKTLVTFFLTPMLWFGGISVLSASEADQHFPTPSSAGARSEGDFTCCLDGTALLLGHSQ